MENTTTSRITIVLDLDGNILDRYNGWTPPVLANYPGRYCLKFHFVEATETLVSAGTIEKPSLD